VHSRPDTAGGPDGDGAATARITAAATSSRPDFFSQTVSLGRPRISPPDRSPAALRKVI
jgi:hypothetical protein